MPPLEIALKYLEIFFSGRDFERLYDIMADDLKFSGPFHQFESARDYIESLQAYPPVDCHYELLQAFENGSFVNLIYQFSKPNLCTPMSQLFEVNHGKIINILLIFDTSQFVSQ